MKANGAGHAVLLSAISWLGLTLALEALYLASGAAFTWGNLGLHLLFTGGLVAAANGAWPAAQRQTSGAWAALLAGLAAAGLAYGLTASAWAAGLLLALFWLLLLALDDTLAVGRGFLRWPVHFVLAALAGAIPAALSQIETRFSDEEFFVALWAVLLGAFWLALALVHRRGSIYPRRPLPLRAWAWWLGILAGLLAVAGLTLRAYQGSFYAPAASLPAPWPGITSSTPWVCGTTSPDPTSYDGTQVFRDLLEAVAGNPYAGAPEYGMLALGTGKAEWASAFRNAILKEAAEGRFSEAANSIKSTQYEAAQRAYYLPRVEQTFPGLFSAADQAKLRTWFAAINRRAMTVEWVDWMYGLAFGKWPEGPYENQENGAGLLATLQAANLGDAGLSGANAAYLARNPRGWTARFRNTDDAYVYQMEWLNNALFQSQATGATNRRNEALSFEWLLLQSLPDGSPPGYNHPQQPPLAGAAYLGAELSGDPTYVWLAGRALAAAQANKQYTFAQPGVERPVAVSGVSPTAGSCLVYGDTGLPNQQGPLAPDKVVFRDGWKPDDAYLLLNLRFSGWHRYKASNTVTLLAAQGVIAGEVLDRAPSAWLPKGRALFRDKRVPRENLNGLLVPNGGLGIVLYALTGIGSPWAQDPPWSGQVVGFQTGNDLDWSHTRLTGWRGWQQDRWVYFYHQGPIVVVDQAAGQAAQAPALAWHLQQQAGLPPTLQAGGRVQLRAGLEAVLVPIEGGSKPGTISVAAEGNGRLGMRYVAGEPDRLDVATVFLPGAWAGALVSLIPGDHGPALHISRGSQQMSIPLYR